MDTATRPRLDIPISSSSFAHTHANGNGSNGTNINGNINGNGSGSSSSITIGIAEGSKMRDRSAVAESGNESTPGPSSATGVGATGAGTGEGKKKKRKGWKGWAMVIEDEQGNIIGVTNEPPPGLASPPRRARGGRPSSAAAAVAASARSRGASSTVDATASAPAVAPIPPGQTRLRRKATTPLQQQRRRDRSSSTIDSIDTEPEILPKSKRRGLDTPIFVNPTPDSGSRDSPDIFEPEPKRARRNSFSTTTLANPYPQPSFPHDILNKPAAAPRHSLPKSKPPRPAPTRLQPGRGGDHTQPNSARATPAAEDRERPALPPPTRVPRSGMGVDGAMPPDSDVRSEAAYIIAQAAKRRDAAAAAAAARVTPPATESTPHTSAASSSNAYAHPLSPPQSLSTGPEPIIVNYSNDEAEEEDFDTAFEKVQEAYRKGIRPHRNPLAPQERTVPIRGMEDAHPPEWRSDQRPGIALAPGRDRTKPTDKDDLAHSQGYDGLTDALNSDATGFVNNVKDNIQHIVTYYFPQPSPRRDAFLESIGRGLANLGWSLTDSSAAVLAAPPPLPLPPLPQAPNGHVP